MALPLFAVTLFTSAFILFLVQPMVGKMILPRLGGTPQVWNTCMVFFQSTLLAGYAYTHFSSTRFTLKRQLTIHAILIFLPLLLFVLFRPFDFSLYPTPPFGENPILWALMVLAAVVGVPFFVVSTSAPLLQKWFRHTGHAEAHDPYFLYIASNLGSMIGLLAYPMVFEPYMGLTAQAYTWVVLFAVFVVLVLICGKMTWDAPPLVEAPQPAMALEAAATPAPAAATTAPAPVPVPPRIAATGITKKKFVKGKPVPVHTPAPAVDRSIEDVAIRSGAVTAWRRLRWTLLAAAPVSLMLGTVSYICTDVTPNPLIWVVFLALYLLTFICVFSRWPVVWIGQPHRFVVLLQPITVLIMAIMIYSAFQSGMDVFGLSINGALLHILLATAAFFCTALVCHGELAKDRPDPRQLTEYFLWMSFGGMLGGMFNGLLAPLVFYGVAEFPLAIILGCLLRAQQTGTSWTEQATEQWFPNLAGFFRKMGDDLAQSYKRKQPHTAYVLSFGLDVLLPALLYFVTILLISVLTGTGAYSGFARFWRLMGIENASAWALNTYRLLTVLVPILICFSFWKRPIRLGLGVAAIIGLQMVDSDSGYIYRDRSYFGVLRVAESTEYVGGPRGYALGDENTVRTLTHGSTLHGLNYQKVINAPDAKPGDDNYVDPDMYRRYATTYYHPYGPVGTVMHKYDWFDDRGYGDLREYGDQHQKIRPLVGRLIEAFKEINNNLVSDDQEKQQMALNFWKDLLAFKGEKGREGRPEGELRTWLKLWSQNSSDARLPASLVGLGLADLGGLGGVPLQSLVGAWSEPPYATIGLGTGTMASYSRYLQHMHFYEIDNQIRRLNLPEHAPKTAREEKYRPAFNYLKDALEKRLACIQVRMGDARLRMALPYAPYWTAEGAEQEAQALAEDTFSSHVPLAERNGTAKGGGPEDFYHMMVVDAFSSDAIPAHLITIEALEMYLTKIVQDGILCVHTSNRHVALVPVVEVGAKFCVFPNLNIRIADAPNGGGATITRVIARGLGAEAGLQAGDVVVQAGAGEVRTARDFHQAADPLIHTEWNFNEKTNSWGTLNVKVKRGAETVPVTLPLQALFARRGHSMAVYGKSLRRESYDRDRSAIAPGDSSSEWVMVARSKDVVDDLQKDRKPDNYRSMLGLDTPPFYHQSLEAYFGRPFNRAAYQFWMWPREREAVEEFSLPYPWTDEYSNLFGVFRWGEGAGSWSAQQWAVCVFLLLVFGAVGVVLWFVANKKTT